MKILVVTYDCKLTFRTHIMQLVRIAASKLASLRRISLFLNAWQGCHVPTLTTKGNSCRCTYGGGIDLWPLTCARTTLVLLGRVSRNLGCSCTGGSVKEVTVTRVSAVQ
ncbi:hypothetical protein E2C01_073951 [Portunus trituberculatus]|uniref:Uncharacterized protein n=1 Tax=Portunus trituberculatus TaxID=210409 RepID=A0A5B7IAV4_PORTR|nr:hypothetical protein [Portunus trituberculatus]